MSAHEQLLEIIGDVRRRWRLKLLVRGAAAFAIALVAALIVAAWGLQWMRFTPESILTARIALGVTVLAAGWMLLVRPLLRRVGDEQVALYLEEHEPSLETAILTAVETEKSDLGHRSPALLRKLVETAVARAAAVEHGRRVEREPLRRYSGTAAGVLALAVLAFLFGPAYMRHALSALLVISRSVEAAAPYRIEVTPGRATVARGADFAVTAKLIGFQADQAAVMLRKSPTAAYERLPLIRGDNDSYSGTMFDVTAPLEYFVEAAGVRSPVFNLEVADMPYVQRLELTYEFPAYTGLEPRKIEDGGDIAVLRGTRIHVRAFPTMTAAGGQIVVDDQPVAMQAQPDGSLAGAFVAAKDGFYRVDLEASNGGPAVNASPKYSIDVLADQPPSVSFVKPGRDTTASPIEEVFLEAKAEDDYGIKSLELVYSVNGGPEQSVKLMNPNRRMPEISAGHTIYLEELHVNPGDSISYYARAYDNNTVGAPQRGLSDMYFVRVRPLEKDFRKADSQAGAQGGGQQQNQVGALSQQEKQIIAATFNIQRDRASMTADRLHQNAVVVALMQKRLRDQVNELLTNFATRVGDQAEQFKKITDLLKQSVPEMQTAEGKLQASSPDGALPPEQRALQFLQKAEEEYQLQVAVSQGGGGGGGGQQNQMADELADLFDLEVDRMANQYETAQRATQDQADQKIDELAEKLKELARRQEQEAERQRRMAAAGQSSGGGDSQRALAQQAEEAARQLEKLSRDENRPELAQSARRLQQAADAMRRAAANGDPNASAQASAATEQLREAQRQLEQAQSARSGRDLQDAMRKADALSREQQGIQNEVNKLANGAAATQDQIQQLSQRKNDLAGQVDQFERQLDQSAASMFRNEKDASRKLTDAANLIRDRRIRDNIKYSDQMLRRGGDPKDVAEFERAVQSNLDDLKRKIGEAASAVGNSKADAATQTLERARQLAQGMESMGERMQQGQQSQQGQQGQRGQQQGQQGQQGQQSQQGQQGQRGQQGQQGQDATSQGQAGNGGRNQGAPTEGGRNGEGANRGSVFNPNAAMTGGPRTGRFSPDDIRQFRGEARQRAADAEQLRRLLQQQKIDPKDIDEIIRGLKQLDNENAYQNPEAISKLQSAVTESIKRFEYTLRRRLDTNANDVFLSGSDEVPDQYRKLVEQYYRSLSKGGGK